MFSHDFLKENHNHNVESVLKTYTFLNSKSVDLNDAPFDQPLFVISEFATVVDRSDYKYSLPIASVVIKLDKEKAGQVHSYYDSEYTTVDEGNYLLVILKHPVKGIDNKVKPFEVKTSKTIGIEVINAEQVLLDKHKIINHKYDFMAFIKKARREHLINEYRKFLEPDSFTVLILDSKNSTFSRSWKSTADRQFAIERTVGSEDVPHSLGKIEQVIIID